MASSSENHPPVLGKYTSCFKELSCLTLNTKQFIFRRFINFQLFLFSGRSSFLRGEDDGWSERDLIQFLKNVRFDRTSDHKR
jgi:hypothetical protein